MPGEESANLMLSLRQASAQETTGQFSRVTVDWGLLCHG